MTPAGKGHWAATVRQPCHFGEWLQGRLGRDGPVVLVTLRPDRVCQTAQATPAAGLSVKAPFAAAGFPVSPPVLRRYLAALRLPPRGRFLLRPAYAPGLGTGASTAALLAIARLAGYKGPADPLARACIAAEGASDPLMFDQPDRLLWASRLGHAMAVGPSVPRVQLLAGFYGPPLPTRAEDAAYDDVSDLVAAWLQARTAPAFAAIASESAARCLARRGPMGDPTAQLARDLGALGCAASHSGAARALIFAPGTVPDHGPALMREAGLRNVHRLDTGRG